MIRVRVRCGQGRCVVRVRGGVRVRVGVWLGLRFCNPFILSLLAFPGKRGAEKLCIMSKKKCARILINSQRFFLKTDGWITVI